MKRLNSPETKAVVEEYKGITFKFTDDPARRQIVITGRCKHTGLMYSQSVDTVLIEQYGKAGGNVIRAIARRIGEDVVKAPPKYASYSGDDYFVSYDEFDWDDKAEIPVKPPKKLEPIENENAGIF